MRPDETTCRSPHSTGDIDAIVVHRIDRLARNMEDHIAIRAAFRQAGVTLVSVTENLEEPRPVVTLTCFCPNSLYSTALPSRTTMIFAQSYAVGPIGR